mmetsp:Transcript_25946/g.55538  ORF Transcript_25946/g.55538 Transcript_25946/m.55538 type:complete len:428 (-) Transcript_25946:1626-2909(-)
MLAMKIPRVPGVERKHRHNRLWNEAAGRPGSSGEPFATGRPSGEGIGRVVVLPVATPTTTTTTTTRILLQQRVAAAVLRVTRRMRVHRQLPPGDNSSSRCFPNTSRPCQRYYRTTRTTTTTTTRGEALLALGVLAAAVVALEFAFRKKGSNHKQIQQQLQQQQPYHPQLLGRPACNCFGTDSNPRLVERTGLLPTTTTTMATSEPAPGARRRRRQQGLHPRRPQNRPSPLPRPRSLWIPPSCTNGERITEFSRCPPGTSFKRPTPSMRNGTPMRTIATTRRRNSNININSHNHSNSNSNSNSHTGIATLRLRQNVETKTQRCRQHHYRNYHHHRQSGGPKWRKRWSGISARYWPSTIATATTSKTKPATVGCNSCLRTLPGAKTTWGGPWPWPCSRGCRYRSNGKNKHQQQGAMGTNTMARKQTRHE